jgi:hypothetical protein
MIDRNNSPIPFWLAGVLVALLLIAVSAGGRLSPQNEALRDQFRARPTDPAAPTAAPLPGLSQLPAEVRALAERLRARLEGGAAVPALTPVAAGGRVRVQISGVSQTADGVRVSGTVTNISGATLDLPVRAFELHDSAGGVYASGASGSIPLAPSATTPLDVTVPLPAGRGLVLRVLLPPDPPLEQVLLVAS